MKKSRLYLILALTLPVLTSLVGIAAGAKRAESGKEGDRSPFDQVFGEEGGGGGSYGMVFEKRQPVGESLHIEASVAQVDLSFDPALKGEALVKVEAQDKRDPVVKLQDDRFVFYPNDESRGLKVTLVLPVRFESLSFEFHASRCRLQTAETVEARSFDIDLNAGECEFGLAGLETSHLSGQVNAGNLTFRVDQLDLAKAGEVLFENSAGKSEISLAGLPEHKVVAQTNMGKIRLDRGGSVETISGLNQERVIAPREGLPIVQLQVNMGMMEATLKETL